MAVKRESDPYPIVVALIFGFGLVACLACRHSKPDAEENPVSWQTPSDQSLLDAATAGFQGKEPDSIAIFSSDNPTPVKCEEKVSGVYLHTPLSAIQQLGYDRRKEFGVAPVLGDVTKFRNSAAISFYYGTQSPDEVATLAVSSGGLFYKPKQIEVESRDPISCDSASSLTWGLRVLAHFEGPNTLPSSGKGTIVIRRDGKEDTNIDVDFDSIPTSFITPAQ